jgi:3-ketosteroid 9alpha-monooxygenase subunit A
MTGSKDYKLGQYDFPRGWFMVAEASELLGTTPKALRFFGKDFALYRGQSGKLVILDAHCIHMGAHLASGKEGALVKAGTQIEGDSIRCPYHGWRYDSSGQVDNIPRFDGPCPKNAKLQSYPVAEIYGAILMWHDAERGEPDYAPPSIPEWSDSQWISGPFDHLDILSIHPQEILDNMADSNHFGPVHGVPPEYFTNEFSGHLYHQLQGGFRAEYNAYLRTDTCYCGPGLLISRQDIGETKAVELICHTPVEDGRVQIWNNVLIKASNHPPSDTDRATQREYQRLVLAAFQQDFDIWSHKAPAVTIKALPTERNFALGRTWYRQFYNPRSTAHEYHSKVNGAHPLDHLAAPPANAYLYSRSI